MLLARSEDQIVTPLLTLQKGSILIVSPYDVESKLFYTLSGDNILEMELTQDEIIRVDTTLRKLKVDGKAQRLSSFGGKPFVSVEHGLNLSDIYMVDSNSTLKAAIPY
jgi:hypothetical protein